MNYDWNINLWAEKYLPALLRKPKRLALLQSFLSNIANTYTGFSKQRIAIEKLLKYSSETIAQEAMLNDIFDEELRRITITTNANLFQRVYVAYTRSLVITNQQKKYVALRSESIAPNQKHYVGKRNESYSFIDFTVNVPSAILAASLPQLTARINAYKLAGMNYNFNGI